MKRLLGALAATVAVSALTAAPAQAATHYVFGNPAANGEPAACLTGTIDDNAVFFSACDTTGPKRWATPAVDGGVHLKRYGANECIAIVPGAASQYDVKLRECTDGAGTQKWTRTGDQAWRSVLHPAWCITRDYSDNAASVRLCSEPGLTDRQVLVSFWSG